jgi:hypothetical protein
MSNAQCSICTSGELEAVNEEIKRGVALRKIAKDFSFSKSSVQRHRKHLYNKEAKEVPDGIVTKVSTLYDADGEIKQQWVMEKPEDRDKLVLWREIAKGIASDIEPLPEAHMAHRGNEGLMVCYPIGDLHLGMLSWSKETGTDWDLKIGQRVFDLSTEYLIDTAPEADTALVAFLGDFMHYDSFEAVTPTGGNLLDADSRYPKMVRVALESARRVIERAASKHRNVRVIVEIGNHDLSGSVFMAEALHMLYSNNPCIIVDTSPSHFHYVEHGKVLIGTHHGHGPKPDKLPGIMAADRSEAWGRTKYRYWLTGHIHTQKQFEFPGCLVESFRVLAPQDAWASNKGYRSGRDMKAIVYHIDFGEVSRVTVNPEMFRE